VVLPLRRRLPEREIVVVDDNTYIRGVLNRLINSLACAA
jgi:hypothetical protein